MLYTLIKHGFLTNESAKGAIYIINWDIVLKPLDVEQLSLEGRKTRTKEIALANHKYTDSPMNQSKLKHM